jgi:hypothetical protein
MRRSDEQGERKASHAEAHYRAGEPGRRCGLCEMFHPQRSAHRCDDVEDPISADDLCDYFERDLYVKDTNEPSLAALMKEENDA